MTKKITFQNWINKYSTHRRIAKEIGVSHQTVINWCKYINSPYGRNLIKLKQVNERCIIENKDLIDIDHLLEKSEEETRKRKKKS